MGLRKRLQKVIVPRSSLIFWLFFNPHIGPMNNRSGVVFSFRPINSIVFWNVKMYYFITSWTLFFECWCNGLLKCISFSYQNFFLVKIHIKVIFLLFFPPAFILYRLHIRSNHRHCLSAVRRHEGKVTRNVSIGDRRTVRHPRGQTWR